MPGWVQAVLYVGIGVVSAMFILWITAALEREDNK